MKRLITTGTILLISCVTFAQEQKRQTTVASSVNGSASAVLENGARLEGELQSTLDVRKAAVGDKVVLKTTRAITDNGQTVVPKGSRLIGRVTEIQRKTKENKTSRLGLVFDRLEGGDLSSQINASIISITKASTAGNAGAADADIFGSSSASSRSSGSASAGGTLPGGGLLGGVTNTVSTTLNTGMQTAGSVTGATAQTVNTSVGSTIRTINGIQISNAINGSAHSGSTLEAKGGDLRLEKGTAIQLQVNGSARGQ